MIGVVFSLVILALALIGTVTVVARLTRFLVDVWHRVAQRRLRRPVQMVHPSLPRAVHMKVRPRIPTLRDTADWQRASEDIRELATNRRRAP